MAKTREQKAEIIAKMEDAFKSATSTVFVHFSGVNVADESALRRSLKGADVSYYVARKTLIRRALEKLGYTTADVPLDGEVAVAWSTGEDATAPARLIHEAADKLADKLAIIGGIFEGKLVGKAVMQEIATIPSVTVLRGMFANVINAPIAGLAIALKAVADKKGA